MDAQKTPAAELQRRQYKLTYFDVRGRAETIRMMLTMSGQKFNDVRIQLHDWPQHKPTMPLEFLPVLETEEGQLSQTIAICNFIATRFGYQPKLEWDRAQSESLMITANDLAHTVGSLVYMYTIYKMAPVPEDIDEKRKQARNQIEAKCNFFKSLAKPGATYLFGDKITVADLFLYNTIDYVTVEFPETRTSSEWLGTWLSNMEADTKLADYLKNRPVSKLGT